MHKLFHHIFTKWPSIMAVSIMSLIRALVSQLRETQALACGGGDGVQTKTIISPKLQIFGDIITSHSRYMYAVVVEILKSRWW